MSEAIAQLTVFSYKISGFKHEQFGIFLAMRWMLISTLTISDEIIHETDFHYKNLSPFPSKLATIEYYIGYNQSDFVINHWMCGRPVFDIYTTQDDENLRRRCSYDNFGQLRNENLHTRLLPMKSPYRFTTCEADAQDTDVLHCYGKTIIQDFIPRNYGFSLGCECRRTAGMPKLKGLVYNISIYDQSNTTECVATYLMSQEYLMKDCTKLYPFMSLPNLIGDHIWQNVMGWTKGYALLKEVAAGVLDKDLKMCYKDFDEVICHVVVPKCDLQTEQVIHPCKETCHEMIEACVADILSVLLQIKMVNEAFFSNWELSQTQISSSSREWFNCDYLPSKDGPIPCFHKQVTCQIPPNVGNAEVSESNSTFSAKSEVKYTCQSDAFHMEGNSTSTCLYSGHWSEPPKCNPRKTSGIHPLIIVLPLLIIPFVILMATVTISCCKRREVQSLTRQREFDAFVCYNFDTDREFAEEVILTELSETHDPPLKLCFHSRDFKLGVHIKENIIEAIRNSNSAIIVLSQGFVDSIWCKEEFADCYIENMKDPAFRLFVILMEPVENLENISEYMKSFFEKKTYLLRNDPQLFQKIREYLEWVKKTKDANNGGVAQAHDEGHENDRFL